ncbi:MAG: dienelactone hydrolase family protein [Bdellovibrionaceae bacterium]|nr:dienelactone hydrolase family protein [Pseudobdellovibrionaceae bacterium]
MYGKTLGLLALTLFTSATAFAKLHTKTIEYKEGDTVLEGVLYHDDKFKGARPAVIVVHEWMGLDNYAKSRAQELAAQGYIALAADIYGKGVKVTDLKQAGELAGKYKSDRALLRKRAQAAFDTLLAQKNVNKDQMLAIGFCFGGTTVLELARAGAPVAGVVSFHGGLDSPTPADAKSIKAKVLVLHGAIDPFVKPAEIAGFYKEMDDAKVDYQFISYAGAVHKFSNPEAGDNVASGAAYNKLADQRSQKAMRAFFDEIVLKK